MPRQHRNRRLERSPGLRADCANCFGLCCVALPFTASTDFAISKDAGCPCVNLQADFRCRIHQQLRARGFPGCVTYDCFGAGQKVSQTTFGGRDWRTAPAIAPQMFAVFPVMRQLHELLWYLAEALTLPPARTLHGALRRAMDAIDALTHASAETLAATDVPTLRRDVDTLLSHTSDLVRAEVPGRRQNHRRADLIGADLRGADLRGACLRGAHLIAADLGGADLRAADFIGADLRDARLGGADLTGSIFLTQPQLNAARGNLATKLPTALTRPAHWHPTAGHRPA